MSTNREYTPEVSPKVNLCRVSVFYAQYFSVASGFSDCTTKKKCQNVSLNESLQLKLHFEKQQKRKQSLNFSWGLMKYKILLFSPHLFLKHYLILCRKN